MLARRRAKEGRLPMKHVMTSEAPRPIGPYSQGVVAGGFLFLSGQIALDPATGEMAAGGIEAETERVLENLSGVLREARLATRDVVKTTVYLADMAEFPKMNAVYARYFGEHPPARSTIQAAGLPRGARVEIDLIAAY
jgi:2-iminobutanoate/2-iminopropanoate deaminase